MEDFYLGQKVKGVKCSNGDEVAGEYVCDSGLRYGDDTPVHFILVGGSLIDCYSVEAILRERGGITDTDRLDFLQQLNNRHHYTGKCELRDSDTGRGWRFHETSRDRAFKDVRAAINDAMLSGKFNTGELP